MSFLEKINFGFARVLPTILQIEATECGLACLGMIASYHGYKTDLVTLRRRFSISLKGSTLTGVMKTAEELDFASRPLRVELDELNKLRLPCMLHWDFNHFVVLKAVRSKAVTIHDPAYGARVLSLAEVSKSFTGVALELWPSESFKPQNAKQSIHLRTLMGRVSGILEPCIQIILLALLVEILSLISPFFLQWVIDNVILSADRNLLTTLAIGFGLLGLMQQIAVSARSWVILYLSTTIGVQWQANVLTHLIRLPVQYFEKRHLGDLVSRFSSTEVIQRTLTTSFIEAILDGIMSLIAVLIMFIYSPTLSMVAIVAMILYVTVRCAWFRPLRNASEEQIVHAARQESHLLETMRGVKAIKLFSRQEERRAAWLALLVDQVNAQVRMSKLQIGYRLTNGMLFGVENILIIWLGAHLVLDGKFSVGVLTAFISYKTQFASRVSALVDKFFEVKMLQLQGERLADIVLAEPEVAKGAGFNIDWKLQTPGLTLRGIRYRYSEYEPYVLTGVDLHIPSGTSVAIVGPSGCGKTTLLNILLGILPIKEGEILIGDVPLTSLGANQFREIVGTVLQDDVLFAGSLADNITFFDPKPDHNWMVKCAELAAIADDISELPMGYNTLIGDMGTVLSGGQKQRVLLARALYKRPQILFLDEATSHLDVQRERQVNQAIKSLNITRIIIAHRPETIASAERVVVLNSGRVTFDGRQAEHSNLIDENLMPSTCAGTKTETNYSGR